MYLDTESSEEVGLDGGLCNGGCTIEEDTGTALTVSAKLLGNGSGVFLG